MKESVLNREECGIPALYCVNVVSIVLINIWVSHGCVGSIGLFYLAISDRVNTIVDKI